MNKYKWHSIRDFNSMSEYRRFLSYLDGCMKDGFAEEISCDPNYGSGEVFGGRWFKEVATGKTWRLIEPDFPFRGLWEPIEEMDAGAGE
ncbi:hypothetical protein LAG73_05915 [Pseudoxanthomonas japonensis]|nr:hypothetical protein LAG73_05915 [Pseudoxanthomonas japonensis]